MQASGIVSNAEFIRIISLYQWAGAIKQKKGTKKKPGYYYFNLPAAFDIETTSYYYNGDNTITENEYNALPKIEQKEYKKGVVMYEWTFGFDGLVTAGRTWDEFETFIKNLRECLINRYEKITPRIIVYVHNLAYEFQFIRRRFIWESVFSIDERKPVYAIEAGGDFEFRCSLILTGKKLEKVAEDCHKYPCRKQTGDLDYTVQRTPLTPLTAAEWGYCEADVRVVMSYIQEQIEKEGTIQKIPLTKTGYVRRDVREYCLFRKGGKNPDFAYMDLMQELTLEPAEYTLLKAAFAGGFTHASAWHNGQICKDVFSKDFTSSYPAVMVGKRCFPMSKGKKVQIRSKKQLKNLIENNCCLFDLEIKKLTEKIDIDHYLSKSKCTSGKNFTVDNGRVVKGENIRLQCTELDLILLARLYHIEGLKIIECWVYKKGYLPRKYVEKCLEYYKKKTELKDVKGSEDEYAFYKELLNSLYGMMVTDINRDSIVYAGDEWTKEASNLEEVIERYNSNPRRFLSYAWGIWVTAQARFNLWSGILALGYDYIYSDTDSVKYKNPEKHEEYFKAYNSAIDKEMKEALVFQNLPADAYAPKNKAGKRKPLGYWNDDGEYSRFITLGAKRYMYEDADGLHITIAGVQKKAGAAYLESTGDPFKNFKFGLLFPYGKCGKLTHTYIDTTIKHKMRGIDGAEYEVYELSGVHLCNAQYNMSCSDEYEEFLEGLDIINGVKNGEK